MEVKKSTMRSTENVEAGIRSQDPLSTSEIEGGGFRIGYSTPLLVTIGVWVFMGIILSMTSTDNRLFFSAFVLVGWSLCVLVHEMGHAAFATWAGDASVEHYTTGNFPKWTTTINNYVVPLCATGIFGVGINGG